MSEITLHPDANDLLFKYYRTVARIFRDVLGQLEIDYMGIALLTEKNELLFFSSRPGIEWHMIEHHLWLRDGRFQPDFFTQEQPQIWTQMPRTFCIGLSIPSVFEAFRVVYTFASKSHDASTQALIFNEIATLIRMGRFCLQNILRALPDFNLKKSHLKLIINNEVPHEIAT